MNVQKEVIRANSFLVAGFRKLDLAETVEVSQLLPINSFHRSLVIENQTNKQNAKHDL